MFEAAVKSKLRFPFKGLISIEDLYDLNLENLDLVFKVLNSQLKLVSEESLLNKKSIEDQELELKIEIVKYIVGEKIQVQNKKLREKELKEQKQKIAEIIADKQEGVLKDKSVEELQAMLQDLDK